MDALATEHNNQPMVALTTHLNLKTGQVHVYLFTYKYTNIQRGSYTCISSKPCKNASTKSMDAPHRPFWKQYSMKNHLFRAIFILSCLLCGNAFAQNELYVVYAYGHENKKSVLGDILLEFGKRHTLNVKAEFLDQGDLKTDILRMKELNALPDLIIMPADHLGLHGFIQYSKVDPKLFRANIPERIWGSGMSDGNVFGAPFIQGNHLMMYYNKNLVSEPAANWDALVKQHTELTKKGIATIAWSYDEAFWFLPFLGAYGGWPLRDGTIELNTPAMVSALDLYKDILDKKLPSELCSHQCIRDNFAAGKVAYTINGEWEGVDFYKKLGDNLGVSAIPAAGTYKMISAFSTYVIAYPQDSLNGVKKDKLVKLTNYLQSSEIQKRMWDEVGAIPVEANAFASAQQTGKDYLRNTLNLMQDTRPLPADSAMSFIWDPIQKGILQRRETSTTSHKVAAYMQMLAERNIGKAKAQAERKDNPEALEE